MQTNYDKTVDLENKIVYFSRFFSFHNNKQYCSKFCLTFNVSKTKRIVFGCSSSTLDSLANVCIDNVPIEYVRCVNVILLLKFAHYSILDTPSLS